jgi:hypothetical protein
MSMEIKGWDDLPALSWEEKVALLAYRTAVMEQNPAPVTHTLSHNMYIREMHLKAGTLVVGRKHLKGHTLFLTRGSAVVITNEGRFTFKAPAMYTSSPGDYTVAYTLEDCVVRTGHPDPKTMDLKALENEWFGDPSEVVAHGKHIQDTLCQDSLPQLQ